MKRKGAVQLSFILGLLILTIALGLVSYLVQQPQDIRQRAAETNQTIPKISPKPMTSYGIADKCKNEGAPYHPTYSIGCSESNYRRCAVPNSLVIHSDGETRLGSEKTYNHCLSFWNNSGGYFNDFCFS